MNRDAKIVQLRNRKVKLGTIAEKFGITPERVRQIYEKRNRATCKIHKSPYHKICEYCVLEKTYRKSVENLPLNRMLQEVLALTKENRKKAEVIKRQILIKVLKDIHGLNFSEIGRLLKRDHSSIRNLYEK